MRARKRVASKKFIMHKKTIPVFVVLLIFVSWALFLYSHRVQALDLGPYKNVNNTYKYFIPRSSVLFSPRWAETIQGGVEYGPIDGTNSSGAPIIGYLNIAARFNADKIFWHYPKDTTIAYNPTSANPYNYTNSLISKAKSDFGFTVFNCALPAQTKNPEAACKDSAGNPIAVSGSQVTFYPDTNSSTFKQEVHDFLVQAKSFGCTAFQQDDPQFMVARQVNGCYQNLPRQTVQQMVYDFYHKLTTSSYTSADLADPDISNASTTINIPTVFGKTVPLTYNKKFKTPPDDEMNTSYNTLAPYFNAVVAEVEEVISHPIHMLYVIQDINDLGLNLSTSTSLVSQDVLKHQQHIAMSYALGATPLAPYDLFIGTSLPRFYGDPDDYKNYFSMVKNNKSYFDGYGTSYGYYIDDPANSSMVNSYRTSNPNNIVVKRSLSISNTAQKNVAAILRSNVDARVLHVVNSEETPRTFTFYIPKEDFSTIPTKAYIITPDSQTPVQLTSANFAYEKGKKRIKVTVPQVSVWSVVKFE